MEKWISVKDRLPEQKIEEALSSKASMGVLVFTPVSEWIGIGWLHNDQWGRYSDGKWRFIKVPITHWMPLPAPPAKPKI